MYMLSPLTFLSIILFIVLRLILYVSIIYLKISFNFYSLYFTDFSISDLYSFNFSFKSLIIFLIYYSNLILFSYSIYYQLFFLALIPFYPFFLLSFSDFYDLLSYCYFYFISIHFIGVSSSAYFSKMQSYFNYF